MVEVALALGLTSSALLCFRRLGLLHPATLWLMPWAVMTMLLAMQALPYRGLTASTAAVIAIWTTVFCAGTLIAPRMLRERFPPDAGAADASGLGLAAALACALAATGLAAFLVQVAATHGLRAAIVSDADVRLDIGAGATPYTIKYIYFAFAASALAAVAAGRAASPRARWTWILVAVLMIGLQYFSTGRSNLFLAAVMACSGYALAAARPISRLRTALAVAAVGIMTAAAFVGMGSLLGKSFENSEIATYDNVFVRHDVLRPAALPYQYVTAPLPAFDILRQVTPEAGRGGCRTLSPLCSIGRRVGVPVSPEPSLTGYTADPGAWNTFTALYGPLVDGGPLLGTLIVVALGSLFGLLWAWVRSGSVYALVAYAVMSSALVYSTVENTLLQPHLVGAALIAVVLNAVASRVRPLVMRRGVGWASP